MRRKGGRDVEAFNPAAASIEKRRRPQSPRRRRRRRPAWWPWDYPRSARSSTSSPGSRSTAPSPESAAAAIASSRDPDSAITLNSRKVQVLLATDPLAKWREGAASTKVKDSARSTSSASSKLLRAGLLLSRHGHDNRLCSAVMIPRKTSEESALETPFQGRGIIAYDDIL